MSDALHDRIQQLKHDRKNYRSPNAAPYEPNHQGIATQVAKAPRCEHCRRPMLCGQKIRHLTCMPTALPDTSTLNRKATQ